MKLCKPYRSPIQAVFILVFTSIFVLMTAFIVPYFPDVAIYLRLLGGVFLLLGAVLLFRYTLTEFVYGVSRDTFTVCRITGFASRNVATIELTENTCLYTKAEFKKIKTAGGKSYRQNLTAATAFLVYEKNGRKYHLEFEPYAEFYEIVKQALQDKRPK